MRVDFTSSRVDPSKKVISITFSGNPDISEMILKSRFSTLASNNYTYELEPHIDGFYEAMHILNCYYITGRVLADGRKIHSIVGNFITIQNGITGILDRFVFDKLSMPEREADKYQNIANYARLQAAFLKVYGANILEHHRVNIPYMGSYAPRSHQRRAFQQMLRSADKGGIINGDMGIGKTTIAAYYYNYAHSINENVRALFITKKKIVSHWVGKWDCASSLPGPIVVNCELPMAERIDLIKNNKSIITTYETIKGIFDYIATAEYKRLAAEFSASDPHCREVGGIGVLIKKINQTILDMQSAECDPDDPELKTVVKWLGHYTRINEKMITQSIEFARSELKFDFLIVDECHKMKSKDTINYMTIKELSKNCKYLWGLTATPIGNSPGDLWAQLDIFLKEKLGSHSKFMNRYFYYVKENGFGKWVEREGCKELMAKDLRKYIIRIARDRCFDIPKITETVINYELTAAQKKAYREAMRDFCVELEGVNYEITTVVMAKLQKMLQIINSFMYVEKENGREAMSIASNKEKELMELIAEFNSKKAVIWYTYQESRKLIVAALENAKIRYTEDWQEFQKIEAIQIYIGNCSGDVEGIELDTAHYVIYYSTQYSYINHFQSTGRFSRMREVEVRRPLTFYYMLAGGDGKRYIDSDVYELLQSKIKTAGDFCSNMDAGDVQFRKDLVNRIKEELKKGD